MIIIHLNDMKEGVPLNHIDQIRTLQNEKIKKYLLNSLSSARTGLLIMQMDRQSYS